MYKLALRNQEGDFGSDNERQEGQSGNARKDSGKKLNAAARGRTYFGCNDCFSGASGKVTAIGVSRKSERITVRASSMNLRTDNRARSTRGTNPLASGRHPEPWHMVHGIWRCMTHIGHGNFWMKRPLLDCTGPMIQWMSGWHWLCLVIILLFL